MPASDKQIAANRANSKKSTGAKTEIGHRNSARNSTRHGVLSSVVLLEGESRERFAALVNALHTEYQPETSTELQYIQKAAVALWRQMRTWAVETAGITHEMKLQAESVLHENAATRAMLAFRSLAGNSRHLELMSRYEHRFDREHYRALEALDRRRDRKIAARSQFLKDNKGQIQSDEALQPPVEPKNCPDQASN
jgi:hypothetical protein